MNEQFIPIDLVLEAARALPEEYQRSLKVRLNKLICDERPEQPPPAEVPKIRRPFPPMAPLLALLTEVAIRHRLSIDAIVEAGNHANFVRARREFCKLARKRGYSLSTIGGIIKRHHTSVYHLSVTP